MKEKIVIALGGNAIQTKEANSWSTNKQLLDVRCKTLNLYLIHQRVLSFHMVMVHKLEVLLIQQAKSNSDTTPAMPLDTCGAMSQGMIGYWLETEINRIFNWNE